MDGIEPPPAWEKGVVRDRKWSLGSGYPVQPHSSIYPREDHQTLIRAERTHIEFLASAWQATGGKGIAAAATTKFPLHRYIAQQLN